MTEFALLNFEQILDYRRFVSVSVSAPSNAKCSNSKKWQNLPSLTSKEIIDYRRFVSVSVSASSLKISCQKMTEFTLCTFEKIVKNAKRSNSEKWQNLPSFTSRKSSIIVASFPCQSRHQVSPKALQNPEPKPAEIHADIRSNPFAVSPSKVRRCREAFSIKSAAPCRRAR